MQTLDFAWFLIYLQILLLFQAKDQRKYWLLVMLSLLQVIVATLFNQGIWFGLLLAVYMLLGSSAMTLLLQYRQTFGAVFRRAAFLKASLSYSRGVYFCRRRSTIETF